MPKNKNNHDMEIEDIEKEIDSILESLPIFQLNRNEALIHVLKFFEDESRINTEDTKDLEKENIIRIGTEGLNFLIPRIYKRCQESKKKISTETNWDYYEIASKSLITAQDYSIVKNSGFYLLKQGYYGAKAIGNKIVFECKDRKVDTDSILVMIFNKQRLGASTEDYYSNIENASGYREMVENIKKAVRVTGKSSIEYNLEKPLWKNLENFFTEIVEKNVWELPDSISMGHYAIAHFKKFQKSLAIISIIHSLACILSKTEGGGIDSIPLVLNKYKLVKHIRKISQLPKKIVIKIIEDLTYNPDLKNNDVVIQPLFRVNRSDFLLSPHLIIISNPERNLLKLWARLYKTQFDTVIAPLSKKLENKIAEILKKLDKKSIVVPSRKIPGGTDIDVSALDLTNKTLFIIQVKWFIEPDSSHEVTFGDNRLNNALAQIERNIKWITEDKTKALNHIFKGRDIDLGEYHLVPCIISKGHTGSFGLNNIDIPIFNFDIFEEVAKKNSDTALLNFYDIMKKAHELSKKVKYKEENFEYPLGKYSFVIPVVTKNSS